MANHPSRRAGAVRRNTLAACLAAALAAGGAGAARPLHRFAHGPSAHASSDEALFGGLHTTRASGILNASRQPSPALPAGPATITVESCADDGTVGTLRYAFEHASDGDLIDLSALTCSPITLTSGEIVATVPNLHVQGPGQNVLTVDGNDSGRVFRSTFGLAFSDLTIAHGGNYTGFGGCILISGDLTLTRTTVTGCRAGASDGSTLTSYGGAVLTGGLIMQSSTISASTATASSHAYGGGAYVIGDTHLYDSTIAGNVATSASGSARGGGLFVQGELTVRRTRVRDNTASSTSGYTYGGGIFGASSITIEDSTIDHNRASSATSESLPGPGLLSLGGGLHAGFVGSPPVSVVLQRSTLSGNTAHAHCADCAGNAAGGGGASVVGKLVASYSVIRDNIAFAADFNGYAFGGGLVTAAVGDAGKLELTNSTVSGNNATGGHNGEGGGIMAAYASPLLVVNSTLAFNRASISGGGAVVYGGNAAPSAFFDSIIANNEAPLGADVSAFQPCGGGNPCALGGHHNLIMVVSGDITPPLATLTDDPLLFPLADYGGPTATHALAACSPAVDAGSDVGVITYDQRGAPYVRHHGGAVDIGAFELQQITADYVFGDGFEGVPICP